MRTQCCVASHPPYLGQNVVSEHNLKSTAYSQPACMHMSCVCVRENNSMVKGGFWLYPSFKKGNRKTKESWHTTAFVMIKQPNFFKLTWSLYALSPKKCANKGQRHRTHDRPSVTDSHWRPDTGQWLSDSLVCQGPKVEKFAVDGYTGQLWCSRLELLFCQRIALNPCFTIYCTCHLSLATCINCLRLPYTYFIHHNHILFLTMTFWLHAKTLDREQEFYKQTKKVDVNKQFCPWI